LANALARDAKHRADLFERVLASALEAEVETQNLCVARRQRAERLLDLVGEEAIHCFLFRVRHLVGDEPLDERAIAFGIHRRVEADVARVERRQRLNHVHRKTGQLRELFRARLAVELLAKDLGRLDDSRKISGAVQRHANRASLARERREDRLTDPPHGVGDELYALIRIEFAGSREQTNVAFTDEIDERQAAVLIFFCDRDDEAEVPLHQLLECILVTGADLLGEVDFFRSFEERIGADLVEVLVENIPLRFIRSDSSRSGAAAAALEFGHVAVALAHEARWSRYL